MVLKGHLWNPLIITWDIFLPLDGERVTGDIFEIFPGGFQDLLPSHGIFSFQTNYVRVKLSDKAFDFEASTFVFV